MNKRFLQNLQLLFSALDIIFVNLMLFRLRMLFHNDVIIQSDERYMMLIVILNLGWLAMALKHNNFKKKNIRIISRFFIFIQSSYLLIVAFTGLCSVLFYEALYSSSFVVALLSGVLVLLLITRLVFVELYSYLKRKTYSEDKVVFIGYNTLSRRVAEQMEENGMYKTVIGFCEDTKNVIELSPYPIIGNIDNIIEVCKKYHVTEIYSTLQPGKNAEIYDLMDKADKNCIRFKLISNLDYEQNVKTNVEYIDNVPIVSLRKDPLQGIGNRILKRAFDITFSMLVLVFINSWLIPLIGILIKLESKGPIFFKQLRSGKNNKFFFCYKFRSMHVNKDSDVLQAGRNDARVTRIGRFLRKTSLDEFPQFFNVLKGDMSIVGPRPHMLKHTDHYSNLIDDYMVRHFVKPGITGWAQVNGFRGETHELGQMRNRIQRDIWYMENWTFMFDLKVIFLTIIGTLRGEENAF